MYLKHWFNERKEQLRKVEYPAIARNLPAMYKSGVMSEFLTTVENEYGPMARKHMARVLLVQATPLAIQYVSDSPKSDEEKLIQINDYVSDFSKRENIHKSLESGFLSGLADREILKSWQRICKFATHLSKADVNLQKAVEAKDWNRITDS